VPDLLESVFNSAVVLITFWSAAFFFSALACNVAVVAALAVLAAFRAASAWA